MTAIHSQPVADVSSDSEDLLTIDQLAAETGISVRTMRYYASLGLLPAPVTRGRMAYYGSGHQARLALIKALQSHGFTLAEIANHVKRIPESVSPEHIALQRAMVTSWSPAPPRRLSRKQVDEFAQRQLSAGQCEVLESSGVLACHGDEYVPMPGFEIVLELFDMGVSDETIVEASLAVTRHMTALADDLAGILRKGVVGPQLRSGESSELSQTIERLRALTLQSVVTGFQRAANELIGREISR